MSDIKLFPGPRLERHEWVYDEATATGHWKSKVVTDRAHEFLFRDVEVCPRVTLADIFGLVAPNPFLLANFQQECVDELCAEYEKGALAPVVAAGEALEYLELYQVWAFDSASRTYQGVGRFNLHGVGPVLSEDFELGTVPYKKGDRIKWGVELAPLREMLHLPVRLNAEVQICEDDMDSANYCQAVQTAVNSQLTLGCFLQKILGVLSAYGSPEQSAVVREDWRERGADDQPAAPESVVHQDIFESLGFDSRNSVYDQFFEAWNPAAAHELYRALHDVEDTQPVQAGLKAALGDSIMVKSEFAELPAREFRKLVRLAQREAP